MGKGKTTEYPDGSYPDQDGHTNSEPAMRLIAKYVCDELVNRGLVIPGKVGDHLTLLGCRRIQRRFTVTCGDHQILHVSVLIALRAECLGIRAMRTFPL